MSAHAINRFTFEFWKGDPPQLMERDVEVQTRAGANGHALMYTGRHGGPFRASLTSDWATYAAAIAVVALYKNLIGAGPQNVVYNGVRFAQSFRHRYSVLSVELSSCERHVQLLGPGYQFAGGARLVTEWTLIPQEF
jgi:hypothetical protein